MFAPGGTAVVVKQSAAELLDRSRVQIWPLPAGDPQVLSAADFQNLVSVGAMTFSPDGKSLAVAEAPPAGGSAGSAGLRASRVHLFDWPGLARRASLTHTAPVTALKFRADSRALLTLTPSDLSIHAWDLTTGAEMARVPVPAASSSTAITMAFTPSGAIAFTDTQGATVVPLDSSRWIQEACGRLSRNLTREEWDLLLGPNVDYQETCPAKKP